MAKITLHNLLNRRAWSTALRGTWRYITGRRGQRRVHGWRLLYRLRTEVLLHPLSPVPVVASKSNARLWVDKEVFPQLQRLISSALHTVVIQMFIWKDDRLGRQMAELLLAVANRGVKVYITKEATGDVFEFHRDFLSTRSSAQAMWKEFWHHPNIRITHETNRDHAKVYIIDGATLCLTGMNVADEYHERLHDYLVELHGRDFVDQYLSQGEVRARSQAVRLYQNTESKKEMRGVVMSLIEAAHHSVVLEQCYISDALVRQALIQASHRGVRITLVVPRKTDFHHHHTNMEFVARLLSDARPDRVAVFLYPEFFHAKTMLVDREVAFIGSTNLIASSLDDMGEVNVLVRGSHHEIVRKLRDTLRVSLLRSRALTTPPRLDWISRWLSWIKM